MVMAEGLAVMEKSGTPPTVSVREAEMELVKLVSPIYTAVIMLAPTGRVEVV